MLETALIKSGSKERSGSYRGDSKYWFERIVELQLNFAGAERSGEASEVAGGAHCEDVEGALTAADVRCSVSSHAQHCSAHTSHVVHQAQQLLPVIKTTADANTCYALPPQLCILAAVTLVLFLHRLKAVLAILKRFAAM